MAENPLTTFKADHHVILGIALIGLGGFGFIGSLTGRLPAMLAALFDSKDLNSQAATSAAISSSPGDVGSFLNGLFPAGSLLSGKLPF